MSVWFNRYDYSITRIKPDKLLGGFYLASSLGYARQATGSYRIGLLVFAALAVLALAGLTGVKKRWRTTWGAAHLTVAKI
jgi:MFS transporter, NNP family, nitrate/nitrite transporter